MFFKKANSFVSQKPESFVSQDLPQLINEAFSLILFRLIVE